MSNKQQYYSIVVRNQISIIRAEMTNKTIKTSSTGDIVFPLSIFVKNNKLAGQCLPTPVR